MATVEDLIKKLDSLPAFVKKSGDNSIQNNKEDIINLNKSQLLSGIDNDGDQLGLYSPKSIEIRKEKGLQTDHIDLRFTGKFQDSIDLTKNNNEFEINATDGKWDGNEISPTLSQQWPDALGLIDTNEDKLTEKLIDEIDKEINNYLDSETPIKI